VQLRSDAPESYVVQPGDTLWSIAGRFLEDPWSWQEVWRSNSGLSNPDKIYPGDVLRLRMVGGKPSIGVDRAGGEEQVGQRGGIRVVKLTPRVRVDSLKEAVPTIPIASIAPFLTQPYVADSDAIRKAPYVVGFPDEHIVAGLGDSIYVRRIDSVAERRFQVLRPGRILRDPQSNDILGYEALFVANAILQRPGDPATLQVTLSEREVSIGDRVIPAAAEEPLSNFYPRPAPAGLRGSILSVLNGVTQVGQFDVVAVDLGTRDRLEPGHVFEIFQGGGQERDQVRQGMFDYDWREETPLSAQFWYGDDWKIRRWRANQPDADTPLPPTVDVRRERSTFIQPFERSGILMIFRTFERVSFGIVLDANRPMHVDDRLAPPPS
jgi:LysM repeat protein